MIDIRNTVLRERWTVPQGVHKDWVGTIVI